LRAVVQRVSRASVKVGDNIVGAIGEGLVVLLGIAQADTNDDAVYLVEKITSLRVFDDNDGRMNLSLSEQGKSLLVVSQFTLYGDVRRGRRPSYSDAASPEIAEPLYEHFVAEARKRVSNVTTGSFRAMMQVELTNDGPVTLLLDSRKLF
jgi:D-tyrosyl-tRNA(Tyr) deacylase